MRATVVIFHERTQCHQPCILLMICVHIMSLLYADTHALQLLSQAESQVEIQP